MDIIPVLDENEVLVGVLESDNILDAYQEEVHEDYAKFAGLTEEADVEDNIWTTIKKRIPWLIVLLFLSFIVSFMISGFENIIITIPVMVFFQSMLLSMSGNVGTQSLAVTITGLNDPQQLKWKRILGKELLTGVLLGLLVSIISFISVFAFIAITKTEIVQDEPFTYLAALKFLVLLV
ncbi:MAG TPA: magnesium transporter [Acholeplasma sp.]|nr:magnesium transporter [Acholeplasma sp.]